MRKIAVISVSGGMDSTCLLMHLLREEFEVYTLSFDYGQKHKIELERLEKNFKYLKSKGIDNLKENVLIKIDQIGGNIFSSALTDADKKIPEGHYEEENMIQTVVPNRNAIFASYCYSYALSIAKKEKSSVNMCLGVHMGDHAIYPDCRPQFYDQLKKAFDIGNWGSELVKFYFPYAMGNKKTILQDCLISCTELNLDFDTILANTNTSYDPTPGGKSSGKSGADIERIEAFIEIGRQDPVPYIGGWEKAKKHAEKILKSRKK